MKEYKVETFKMGLLNNEEKLQDFLNKFAKEGWIFKFMDQYNRVIFERSKNR